MINISRSLQFKLEIYREDDTTAVELTDYFSYFAMDYGNVRNFQKPAAADGLSRTADVTLLGDFNNRFSPFDTSSSYNYDNDVFKELLFPNRKIMVYYKVDDGSFKNVFAGRLGDDIDIGRSYIKLKCRDYAKLLQDRQIVDSEVRSYDSTPIAYETYMQNMLDDVFGAGEHTLVVPVASGLTTIPSDSDWQYKTVWRFLQGLAIEMGGWFVGYWENGTETDFTLQLFEPDRTKTTPDFTISSDTDFKPSTSIKTTDKEIRNYVIVQYYDTSSNPQSVTVQDSTSIALYGKKVLTIDRDKIPTVQTSTAATTMGNAALSDLKDGRNTISADMRYTNLVKPFELIEVEYERIATDNLIFSPDSIRPTWDFKNRKYNVKFTGSENVTVQKNSWFNLQKVNR